MIWSALALVAAMFAYGLAGAQLHTGSHDERGALRSRAWWAGTGAQAVAFLLAALARRSLPLLLVQAVSAGGLAVTALIQHVDGSRRLRGIDALGTLAVVAGLGLVATGTQPGPAVQIRAAHLGLMLTCTVVCGALAGVRLSPALHGLVGGLGFAYGAIGARLVIGDAVHPFWYFWQLPAASWGVGILTVAGIGLGQLHLTRGLARSAATPVLGPAFIVETLFPAAVGLALMGEHPRAGGGLATLVGLALVGVGAYQLLHAANPETEPATTAQRTTP